VTDELMDFIRGCAADCVSANQPDRPLCERCKVELPADRMLRRTCFECADTDEIPQVEAK
jgi:hypothetical protein